MDSSSTQTDFQDAELLSMQKDSKPMSIQTDPCDLKKCMINEPPGDKKNQQDVDDDKDEDDAFDQEYELQRRLNPQTPQDFEQLKNELIQWKHREQRKIAVTARNPSHKRAITTTLLDKEAKLIRKIETLKHAASEQWKVERLEKIMEQMAMARNWSTTDGLSLTVDTPETVRAREMKDMFAKLKLDDHNVQIQARVQVLKEAKSLIERNDNYFPPLLTKDLCSLLDRELEMLAATELGGDLLVGLRKRLLNSFAKLVTHGNDHKVTKPRFAIKK
eukprot:scaffold249339_cov49-Cyclotella_meneghiniana.AAC.5